MFRSGLLIQTCGSYRRGKASCGDCDILITHPDGVSHEHLLFPLVAKLKADGKKKMNCLIIKNSVCFKGFLIDDLVLSGKHDEEPK